MNPKPRKFLRVGCLHISELPISDCSSVALTAQRIFFTRCARTGGMFLVSCIFSAWYRLKGVSGQPFRGPRFATRIEFIFPCRATGIPHPQSGEPATSGVRICIQWLSASQLQAIKPKGRFLYSEKLDLQWGTPKGQSGGLILKTNCCLVRIRNFVDKAASTQIPYEEPNCNSVLSDTSRQF